MMDIGLCAWSFTGKHREAGLLPDPHTAVGLLELARQHRLASIEGAAGWFSALSPAALAGLRSELDATGMAVFADTGSKDLAADPEPLMTALDAAVLVGARLVRTTLSGLLEGDRRSFGADRWRAYLESLVDPLTHAVGRAREKGCVIGLENHQDLCSHELAWLCEQVDSEHLGVVFDVGNAYAVGETPAAFARRVGPHLKHLHLKDYTVHPTEAGYRLKRCALGDGIVDWPAVLAWVAAECPGVAACIELGATTARHIRLFEPSWWQTYPERPFVPDAIEALGDLHRAAGDPADWQTPHEAGADAGACAAYELAQIDASVTYLRGIGAL